MAQYTITLLSVMKSLALIKNEKEYYKYDNIRDFTDENANLIFDAYPIFDELHRSQLNRKIVNHFLFQEIAIKPYQKWVFMLNNKMFEIMPYYNKLFLAQLEENEIFNNVDYTELYSRELNVATDTETLRNSNEFGTRIEDNSANKDSTVTTTQSDTLKNEDESITNVSDVPISRVEFDKYPTGSESTVNTGKNDNLYEGTSKENEKRSDIKDVETLRNEDSNSQSNLQTETAENYNKTVKGKNSGYSNVEVLKQYQDILLNIDMMIIDELETMFMILLN